MNLTYCIILVPFVFILLRYTRPSLIVGHEDGIVRIYDLPKLGNQDLCPQEATIRSSFETKGGPIQTLIVHDITKLCSSNDLIVTDSRGVVTIMCNSQILSRKIVSEHCIHCLQVDVDATGNFDVVTADSDGVLSSFTPYADLWNLRLADIRQLMGIGRRLKVTCILSVCLNTSHGYTTNYTLAADDAGHLCFLQHGTPVLILQAPSTITAMCSGKFLEASDIESPGGENVSSSNGCSSPFDNQVALGTESGAIYIMTNFEIYKDEFANVRLPITRLHALRRVDSQVTDTLIAGGDFDALFVIRNGAVVARHELQSWTNCVTSADIDDDGLQEVIVGCHNKTIHAIKLNFL